MVPTEDQGRPRRLSFAVWHNPLARSADRLEAAAVMLVVTVWLICAPVIAVAGSLVWADVSGTAAREQHTRTATTALLTADAPDDVQSAYEVASTERVPLPARWAAVDGTERTGTVTGSAGQRAGDRIRIWIDSTGAAVDPPLDDTVAALVVLLVTASAWLFLGGALYLGLLTLRWRLNRRRFAAWDRDWALIEPRWSGR
jgi:hypothetical protein